MRRTLPIIIMLICLFACKKDKDLTNHSCGTFLYIDKDSKLQDGGIVEWQYGSGCGESLKQLETEAEKANTLGNGESKAVIFYQGDTRPKVKYLVASSRSNSIIYVRYESNNIPQSSVKYWEDQNYTVETKDLTGLEGANY